jgi:quinol monooxygenase YgiN
MEEQLATMIVRHRVAHFDTWKTVFDELDATRQEHGWIGSDVLRDDADPNYVVIVNHVKDLASAKRYGGSEALRAGMQRAGVIGAPDIQFLNEA